MTDLVVVQQTNEWHRLKGLVLDSVSSPITRRVYNLGLNEFIAWYGIEQRPGFTKATVNAWRVTQLHDEAGDPGRLHPGSPPNNSPCLPESLVDAVPTAVRWLPPSAPVVLCR